MHLWQRRGGFAAALALCGLLAGCGGTDPSSAGAGPSAAASTSASSSAASSTFTNPVLDTDFADPTIVRDGATFYAYATGQAGSSAIAVATSKDLVSWSEPQDALPERPDWQPLQDGLTWAPEVVRIGKRWLMYYVAREQASGKQCLALATARRAAGPFEDTSTGPLLCQRELGGSIDAFAFSDDGPGGDGRRWLFWKNDGNAIGQDTRIWAQRLSPGGTKVEGKPVDTGLRQTRPWQGALVEAPTVVRHDDTYVLFYSANDYGGGEYAMGYATATSVAGPYTDRSAQPWVASRGEASGPGGQAVLDLDGQQWLVYHAWEAGEEGYDGGGQRTMWLDRLTWRPGTAPDQAQPVLAGPTDRVQRRPTIGR